MTHRSFDAALKENAGEAITFNVTGSDYTFTVVTPLPMGQLLLFSRVMDAEAQDQARALDKLIKGWLVESDWEEWDKALGQMSNLEVLTEIINFIVEETTARPTQAS